MTLKHIFYAEGSAVKRLAGSSTLTDLGVRRCYTPLAFEADAFGVNPPTAQTRILTQHHDGPLDR